MQVGDIVRCIDASNGAHFLRLGEQYIVDEVRDDGWLLVHSLYGDAMIRMWEPDRFRLIREAMTA